MKSIIIYYSHSGTTEHLSKELQNIINADMLKLEPEHDLKRFGFFHYLKSAWQVFNKHLPKLINKNVDLETYDLIALGTPVWFSCYTPAIRSFLKTHPIKNKKLILFCTHRGGLGRTFSALEKSLGIEENENQIISEFGLNGKYSSGEKARFIQEWFTEIRNYLAR